MKWFVYTRGTIPLYRLALTMESIRKYLPDYLEQPFNRVLYSYEHGKIWWAWDALQLRNLAQEIFSRCSTTLGLRQHVTQLEKLIDQSNSASEKVRVQNLRLLSNHDLADTFDWLDEQAAPAQAVLDTDIDAVDAYINDALVKQVRSSRPDWNPTQISTVVAQLAQPVHETYVTQEARAVQKAAQQGRLSRAALARLFSKYWWTGLGWEQMGLPTPEKYAKKIAPLARELKRGQYVHQLHSLSQVAATRWRTLRKFRLTKDLKPWLAIIDAYARLLDERKEMQIRCVYAAHLLLLETGRRCRVPISDLEWLWPAEVAGMLLGRSISRRVMRERRRAVTVIVNKQGIRTWAGAAAVRVRKRELASTPALSDELHGLGLGGGVVRGQVKVCHGIREALGKIKPGNILVCGMTTPDYVQVMRRAAAIVTDEGGLTCHAAIVARELHKPCIVGTRTATQVFQDGDRVEVDATHGIVRKI